MRELGLGKAIRRMIAARAAIEGAASEHAERTSRAEGGTRHVRHKTGAIRARVVIDVHQIQGPLEDISDQIELTPKPDS
jgi:hypothetical protein